MKQLIVFFSLLGLLVGPGVLAQTAPEPPTGIATLRDTLAPGEIHYYDVFGLRAGQTLYVTAAVRSGDLDTYVAIGDATFETVYAEDDDSGDGLDSRLQYTTPEDGDYVVAVAGYDDRSSGDYRLVIGVDAPAALTEPVVPDGTLSVALAGRQIRQTTLLAPETDAADGVRAPDAVAPQTIACTERYPRPRLSGKPERLETDDFVIHYTFEGADGATQHFVDAVADAVQRAWEHHTRVLGWALPPVDCGEGGDTRFDIYVRELGNLNLLGVATREAIIGDNINTPDVAERTAAYSYLSIDNDFSLVDQPISVMRSTVAHELMHNIQFGYDSNDSFYGLYESTATWIETRAFPEDEAASAYTGALFNYPDTCLGGFPDTEDGLLVDRIYAEWMLIDSLVQDYGAGVVRAIWQDLVGDDGLPSFYRSLRNLGTTPQIVVGRMAVRNLLRDYATASRFEDRVRVEANINGPGSVTPRRDGVEQLAADYLLVANLDRYTFAIDDPAMRLLLVGIDQPENVAYVHDLDRRGTVDTTRYTYAYLVVLNTRQHDSPNDCTPADWRVQVLQTDEAETPANDETWSARQFIPAG